MQHVLVTVSIILPVLGSLIYVRSIIWGTVRPQRMTRFVLVLITVLSTASLWHSGSPAFYLSLVSVTQAFVIFGLCLWRGMGGWAWMDMVCLSIALVGVVVWQTTGQPLVGLYASIIADLAGNIPALIKTYHYPLTEDWRFYTMDVVAALCNSLAATTLSLGALSYPLYLMVINGAFSALILRRRALLP